MLAIDVLLGTVFIDEYILAIIPDAQKVTVRKSTSVAMLKQFGISANALLTKQDRQNANVKTHCKTKDDQISIIKYSNTV